VAVEEAGSRAVRYRPGTPGQASAVDELIRVYDSDRLAVMQILTANALGRLKRSAIVTFAIAFRLKRKTDDEDDHG
jgi:hypothetical protein